MPQLSVAVNVGAVGTAVHSTVSLAGSVSTNKGAIKSCITTVTVDSSQLLGFNISHIL